MDTSKRHETPLSEAKDFITYITASSMSFMVTVAALPFKSHGGDKEWPRWGLHMQWVSITAEKL